MAEPWRYICHHCKTVLGTREYQWQVFCLTCNKKVEQFDLFGKDIQFSPLCLPAYSLPSEEKIKPGGKIELKCINKLSSHSKDQRQLSSLPSDPASGPPPFSLPS